MSLALLLLMLTTMTAWADEVKYINENGVEVTCANATPIPSGNFTWQDDGDLWFYISGKDEVESYLYFNQWDWGTINLIICDGAERTIKYLYSNKTLNIYGQENNTGKLTIKGGDSNGNGISAEYCLSIYGGKFEISNVSNGISSSEDITINGGNITVTGATSDDGGAICSSSGNITINGGTITVEDTSCGFASAQDIAINKGTITVNEAAIKGFNSSYGKIIITDGTIKVDESNAGFSSSGDITINGGIISVTATGDTGISSGGDITINGGVVSATATGDSGDGIHTEKNISLAGGSVTATSTNGAGISAEGFNQKIVFAGASVNASSYKVKDSSSTKSGSIKIADGLIMSEGSTAYSGTLYDGSNPENGKFEDLDALNTALAGKTLQKLPDYIDLMARII